MLSANHVNLSKSFPKKLIKLGLFLMLVFPGILRAQNSAFTLANTKSIQISSKVTNRDYELVIFLPPSYANSPDQNYPVLYFTDAYWDMPLFYAIHGELVYDRHIPEMIMVGFSYPGSNPNYGKLRAYDLTPGAESANFGGADNFLQFIEEQAIPYIESNYRTQKNDRALAGSSLGGLFCLYTMYTQPNLFQRYISVSPAVEWQDRSLSKIDEQYATQHDSLNVRLFLSHGSAEYAKFRDPIIEFQKKIAKRNYKGLKLLNYTIKGARHSGVKPEGYTRGLRWVFKDIVPQGSSGLKQEFQAQ